MNFLYISPDFPINYQLFTQNLARLGVQVYGLGESPFYSLPENIRESLRWYEQVDLRDTQAVINSVTGMFNQVPDLRAFDVAESHNEYWLELEATLNSHFSIPGITAGHIAHWKRKSLMKESFVGGGIPVARGALIPTLPEAFTLARDLSYPVIIKPDSGVGGNGVHLIHNEEDLTTIFPTLDEPYIMEEYIRGGIQTYDGLTDHDGNVIYESSLNLSHGILDYIKGQDIAFHSTRTIPDELRDLGRRVVSIFGIQRKFFHFEFFKRGDTYLPIEINARPPGGPILDLMNYAMDSDLYLHYATMIRDNRAQIPSEKKYCCAYLSRKGGKYSLSHEEIMEKHGASLVEYTENHPLYWKAMGQYRYIFRSPSENDLLGIMEDVLRKP
ncbi:ATP-grasp domain-containing protein [Myxococcota bacterium]|nr:ATP-grasp domain-containing protein [Myxococcota bacterium]